MWGAGFFKTSNSSSHILCIRAGLIYQLTDIGLSQIYRYQHICCLICTNIISYIGSILYIWILFLNSSLMCTYMFLLYTVYIRSSADISILVFFNCLMLVSAPKNPVLVWPHFVSNWTICHIYVWLTPASLCHHLSSTLNM